MRYQPSLDGVRAWSAILVFSFHATSSFGVAPVARGASIGLTMFFVISGYLITTLLLVEQVDRGGISLRSFYIRRALRLLPAIVLVAAATVLISAALGIGDTSSAVLAAAAAVFYFGNWLAIADPGSLGMLIHTWSLSVEEQYYATWPPALTWLLRRGWSLARLMRWLLGVIVALVVIRTAIWTAIYHPGINTQAYFYNTFARADEALIGSLLGIALVDERWRRLLRPFQHRGVGITAFVVLSFGMLTVQVRSPFMYFGGFTFFAVVTAVMVLHLVGDDTRSPIVRILSVAPLTWLGRRSYGFYLLHIPVLKVIGEEFYSPLDLRVSTYWALSLVVTLVLTALMYRYVEKPFLRLKDRAFRRAPEEIDPATVVP